MIDQTYQNGDGSPYSGNGLNNSAADFDLTTELYPPACKRDFRDGRYDPCYTAEAEKHLGYEWPMIRATQYMEVNKTGDRRA